MTQSKQAIVWTIAGSDSGGGAGIQADLPTFRALNTYGCSVLTAITAQNSVTVTQTMTLPRAMIRAQMKALADDLYPAAIKLGMLGDAESIAVVSEFIHGYAGKLICDPVMLTTTGARLLPENALANLVTSIFPFVDLLTPNLPEAEALLDYPIKTQMDLEKAAQDLLALGPKSVLIKGGHAAGEMALDYWTDGQATLWLGNQRIQHAHNHGSGCTLAAAMAALLARGYAIQDALVIAKMYVTQGIRQAYALGRGAGAVQHLGWPKQHIDLPWASTNYIAVNQRPCFPKLTSQDLGLYPIVADLVWLERLLNLGVKTLQLRIKDQRGIQLEKSIKDAIHLAQQYGARLFINDYWEYALKYQAYGVHLGQEDLLSADLMALARAHIHLGTSTHSYAEIAQAHCYQPSYIAFGPIYPTNSKPMQFGPQGTTKLREIVDLLDYPVVAIGGIDLTNIEKILATGVAGVAMIAAITKAKDVEDVVEKLQKLLAF